MSDNNQHKNKEPVGRPTLYNADIAKRTCDLIATHTIGIAQIIKMYPDLPCSAIIKEWRKKYPEFDEMHTQAKAMQARLLVEEIDEMIPGDIAYYTDDKGNSRIDAPSANLLIAKINNRKWTAARLAPRIYADRAVIDNTHTIKHEESIKDLA